LHKSDKITHIDAILKLPAADVEGRKTLGSDGCPKEASDPEADKYNAAKAATSSFATQARI